MTKTAASGLRRWGGFVLGLLLLAAACVALSRSGVHWNSIRDTVNRAPLAGVVAAILLPLLNLLLSACTFWALTRRFGQVAFTEMLALIGAAWLLNYLPLRPGLAGRVAYHKQVNAIRVRDSARVVIESMSCSAAAIALALAASVLVARFPWAGTWVIVGISVLCGALAVGGVALFQSKKAAAGVCIALACRIADVAVWTLRYWVVFIVIQDQITLPQAAALAGVSQVAMSIPLAGNGLGLREWSIGLVRGSLPASFGATSSNIGAGLTADIFNRVAEVVVAIPVGLICTWHVARRMRDHVAPVAAEEAP